MFSIFTEFSSTSSTGSTSHRNREIDAESGWTSVSSIFVSEDGTSQSSTTGSNFAGAGAFQPKYDRDRREMELRRAMKRNNSKDRVRSYREVVPWPAGSARSLSPITKYSDPADAMGISRGLAHSEHAETLPAAAAAAEKKSASRLANHFKKHNGSLDHVPSRNGVVFRPMIIRW